MKTRNYTVLILMILSSNVSGTDVVEYLKTRRMVDLVSSTETNLTLGLGDFPGFVCHNYTIPPFDKSVAKYTENNEYLVLSPDKETVVSAAFGPSIYFFPVLFKDQRKGFRIIEQFVRFSITNTIMYVALGNVLMAMEEEDVEMIMEMGEWKTLEEAVFVRPFIPREEAFDASREESRRYIAWQRAKGLRPPLREEPQPVSRPKPPKEKDEIPVAPAEVEQEPLPTSTPETPDPTVIVSEAKQSSAEEGRAMSSQPPSRLWLYAVPLLIVAIVGILCLLRKKGKHSNTNR